MMTLLFLLGFPLLFAGVAALVVWGVVRGETRAAQMLEQWLRDNDYQLLQKSTPWIKDNPFFASSNRSQKVFKVSVRDREGKIRQGWVRCGHALVGVAVKQVEVKWDKTANAQPQAEPRDRILPPP